MRRPPRPVVILPAQPTLELRSGFAPPRPAPYGHACGCTHLTTDEPAAQHMFCMKIPSKGQRRRIALFWEGADAFQWVSSGAPYCYVCPMCLTGYLPGALNTNELTLDHVPPKSMAGRKLVVLTCHHCNSGAGSGVDKHMLAREQIHDFAEGTMTRSARAVLQIGGQDLNVTVKAKGNEVRVFGVPQGSDPAVEQAVTVHFDDLADRDAWSNEQLNLRFLNGFRNRESLIGWLRAAYLVAFGLLGYRYILRSDVQAIREMLVATQEIGPRVFTMTIAGAVRDERRILVLEKPFRSLFVQIGRHGVFLPYPDFDAEASLYDDLATRAGESHTDRFSGALARWPVQPMYAFDRG